MGPIIAINTDGLIRVDQLRDDATGGGYINDATVSAQLKDDSENDIDGPVTCAYVAASDGRYEGTLPAATTADLTRGAWYRLEISVTGTHTRTFQVRRQAQMDMEL